MMREGRQHGAKKTLRPRSCRVVLNMLLFCVCSSRTGWTPSSSCSVWRTRRVSRLSTTSTRRWHITGTRPRSRSSWSAHKVRLRAMNCSRQTESAGWFISIEAVKNRSKKTKKFSFGRHFETSSCLVNTLSSSNPRFKVCLDTHFTMSTTSQSIEISVRTREMFLENRAANSTDGRT